MKLLCLTNDPLFVHYEKEARKRMKEIMNQEIAECNPQPWCEKLDKIGEKYNRKRVELAVVVHSMEEVHARVAKENALKVYRAQQAEIE